MSFILVILSIVLLFISSIMYTFITDKLVNSLTNKLDEFIKLVINKNRNLINSIIYKSF